jgi:hypothetical protein
MGINNISAVSNPISFVHGSSPTDIPRASTEKSSQKRISGEEREGNINHSHLDFVELIKFNDRLNSVAKDQRAFEKVNDYIEQMKAQLGRIIKQFPPFPPGSEDRIRALRAYAYFRKVIDQLTIPPREELLPQSTQAIIDTPDAANSNKAEGNSQATLSNRSLEIQISS